MKHIFITGCGRSGTTMLGSILGACREGVATPESDFFMDFYYKAGKVPFKKDSYLSFLKDNYRFRQWDVRVSEIDINDTDFEPINFRIITEKTVSAYARTHSQYLDSDFSRVDHTPSNVKFFRKLNLIFPEAQYIFLVRDPRAVYNSVKDLDWGANSALKAAAIWVEYAAHYFAILKLAPEKVYLVRYEDLVTNPEKELKDICRFLHLTYNPLILQGGGLKLPDYTVAQHSKVGKAPDPGNIDKWKKNLSGRELKILEAICGTLMLSFGYTPLLPDSYRVRFRDQIESLFLEAYFYLANKIRKKKRERL